MAEQFIIRVQIDDERFNAAPQANRVPANSNAGVPLVAAGSVALSVNSQQISREYIKLSNTMSANQRDISEKFAQMREMGDYSSIPMISEKRKKERAKIGEALKPKEITPQEQIQEEKPEPLLSARRSTSLAVATALRVAQGIVSHVQHRSGDRYFNRQLSLGISTASTLGGLAITAAFNPALAGVAAGVLVGSTVIDIVTTAANYDYDRKLDTTMIHNVKEVSGNISYGRRGGMR
jgi:hypothetical protein